MEGFIEFEIPANRFYFYGEKCKKRNKKLIGKYKLIGVEDAEISDDFISKTRDLLKGNKNES